MRQFPCGACKQVGLHHTCPYCKGTGTITDPGCEVCGADTVNVTRNKCTQHLPAKQVRRRNACTECGGMASEYSDICSECCEHEYDWDEGYTCLNCGAQGDIGALIDYAMDTRDD